MPHSSRYTGHGCGLTWMNGDEQPLAASAVVPDPKESLLSNLMQASSELVRGSNLLGRATSVQYCRLSFPSRKSDYRCYPAALQAMLSQRVHPLA
jgi:hypothetical protein